MEIIAYVPLSEISTDNSICKKWKIILSLLKYGWENGDTNIYAMYRLEPEPEFILTNEKIKMPPLDKITGKIREDLIIKGRPMIFRMVDVKELNEQLNNV